MSQFLLNPTTGSVFREEVGTNIWGEIICGH